MQFSGRCRRRLKTLPSVLGRSFSVLLSRLPFFLEEGAVIRHAQVITTVDRFTLQLNVANFHDCCIEAGGRGTRTKKQHKDQRCMGRRHTWQTGVSAAAAPG